MIYNLFRFICRFIFSTFGRWRVTGQHNIPKEGPVMIISNHVSNWDPFLIGSAFNRKVYFMGKAELFSNPLVARLCKELGAFPIKRGQKDSGALRVAIKILRDNKVLGMFPEGTRSRDGVLLPFKPGITMIAYKAKCPVVPVALINSYRIWSGWRFPVEVRIGNPIITNIGEDDLTSENLAELTSKFQQAVEDLLKSPNEK